VYSRTFAAGIATLSIASCCPSPPRVIPKTQENAEFGAAHVIESTVPFVSLEGPFWVSQRQRLIFSDVVEENGAAAKIYEFDPVTRTFSVLPYPQAPITTNGLAVDAQGRLVACERWNGVVARVSGSKRDVLADRGANGGTLNAPNDLVIRADANIYFTDTKWGAKPGSHSPMAVYRITPSGVSSIALEVDMPNGVALSADGATLYVGSDQQNLLWQLPIAADGRVGTASPFAAENPPQAKLHVPDGLCVDDRGRVYVTNNGDDVSAIVVFDSQGKYVGRIPMPVPPSNCTFGGADRRTLYVTTLHAIYELQVNTPGLP
jgi:gluconolactonase